jgi:hypothetical protein
MRERTRSRRERPIRTWHADRPEPEREQDTSIWRFELLDLAGQVARLSFTMTNPERFAEQKSEIVSRMRALARGNGGDR